MKKRLIVFVVAAITCLLFVVTGCTNDDNDDAKASLTPSPTTEVQESSKPSPSATVMPELVPTDSASPSNSSKPTNSDKPDDSNSTGTTK